MMIMAASRGILGEFYSGKRVVDDGKGGELDVDDVQQTLGDASLSRATATKPREQKAGPKVI